MIAFRRAAAAATTLLVTLLLGLGCQPNKPDPETPAVRPPAEQIAAAKERYTKAGYAQVGVTELTDPDRSNAAVSGIDGKGVDKNTVFHFIDIESNQPVSQGTFVDMGPNGNAVIKYDATGGRAPRPGDLVVRTN
jgi:hypothetical protein